MVYSPFVEIEIWDEFNTACLAVLPRRWDVAAPDLLNVGGVGQVSVAVGDPVLDRDPTVLNRRNWVKVWLGDGTGSGRYVCAWQIRRRKLKYVGSGDWADQYWTLSGPTVMGILMDAVVKHENLDPDTGLPLRQDAGARRYYAWTAKPGDWYVSGEWNDAITSHGRWDSHVTSAKSGTVKKPDYKPHKWPDPKAEWCQTTGNSQWQFFRRTLNVDNAGMYRICLTADEIIVGFLDGDKVISRDFTEFGYKSFTEFDVYLEEGSYQWAHMMRKKATPGGDGVDAFLFTCMSLDAKGEPDTVIARSKVAYWKAHDGLPAPGWTQAQVLRTQIQEAQARDVRTLDLLTIDFTGVLASDQGNGEDRAFTAKQNVAVPTGTKTNDLVQKLCEMGNFDVWVDFNATPAQFKLRAAKRRGKDRSNNVTLEPGRNLVGWEVDEVDNIVNAAYFHYEGGYGKYNATASQTEEGIREVGFDLGPASDDDTATIIASAHVERRKAAKKRAGRSDQIERDEDRQPTAAVVGSPGNTPMLDWGTGDDIKVPAATLEHAKQRSLGLTLTEANDSGEISWDPEFGVED